MIGRMTVIGLTGSIGMGKSLAAAMLRRMGLPVFDSDACARAALEPGGESFAAVIESFPEVFDPRRGTIDRAHLGKIVFADPARRRVLESLVHPAVHRAQRKFLLRARRMGARAAVLDIPLLFETGAQTRCDAVLCASAPAFVQRARVLARPGMDSQRLRGVLSAQENDAAKRRRATRVIRTGLGRAATFAALRAFLNDVRTPRRSAKP